MSSASQTSNQQNSVIVTEGETWPGFYAAYCAIKANKFNRVVVAVKDKSVDLVKQLHDLGCEIHQYDPCHDDASELKGMMKHVESLILIPVHECTKSTTDSKQEMIKATRNIVEAAERSGSIKRVMLWSSLGAGLVSGSQQQQQQQQGGSSGGDDKYKQIFQSFHEVERIVKASKIEHEVTLRKGFCDQMFFAFSNIMQSRGLLPLTTSTGKMAPLNIKDLGQAAASMLANPKEFAKWHRQTLQITGKQSVNGPTLTQLISRALNTKIEFQEVNLDQMKEILQKSAGDQMNETECLVLLGYLELLRDNKLDVATNELQDILGREPSNLSAFFQDNPDAFRPSTGSATTKSKHYLTDIMQQATKA